MNFRTFRRRRRIRKGGIGIPTQGLVFWLRDDGTTRGGTSDAEFDWNADGDVTDGDGGLTSGLPYHVDKGAI